MMSDFGGGGEDDILVLVSDDLGHSNSMLDAASSIRHHPNPSSPAPAPAPPPPQYDHGLSTIHQIEQFLLNEDDIIDMHPQAEEEEDEGRLTSSLAFLSDILLDSPLPSDPSSPDNPSPEIDLPNSDHHNSSSDSDAKDVQQPPNLIDPATAISHPHQEEEENEEGQLDNNSDDADPISKKRKRQLRNRDAAVRSRERKKMYIKDLEIKSRYYEAECRRLGMLLQCYLAENHALRLSLNATTSTTQAFDASTTKQESAVLFLESLLLGSLLWFLGIMALLTLPKQLSNLEAAGAKRVGCKILGSPAPRGAGINVHGTLEFQSFMMSKRCRGSRRKMRCSFKTGVVRLVECLFSRHFTVTPYQFSAFC